MTQKKLIYLYSDSTFTPWKENIFARTVVHFLESTPENYYPYITHFVGFSEEFANFLRQFDMVFNVCYGFGDAGQHDIARWLDAHQIPHTASRYEAQVIAKDKFTLPEFCNQIGATTPAIIPLSKVADFGANRYIVKPRFGSLHLNMMVFDADAIPYQELMERDDLIIQPYITGREFTVGVIPNEDASDYMCLQPLEIKPDDNREIYIAGQHYGRTEKVLNPSMEESLIQEMQQTVLRLHKALNLRGMSRTDVRVHEGIIYILDINTMPNLDTNSFLPFIAQSQGISLKELFTRILMRFEKVYHADNQFELV